VTASTGARVTASTTRVRARARITGTVQGVGFRPFVYRLASELGLGGWVRNDEQGVLVEAEGPQSDVSDFFDRIGAEPPPLARVESIRVSNVAIAGEREFRIVSSERRGDADTPIAADAATCDECLSELRDPADRRHRYPFINCTNCGPRFTIVRGVPYDRPLTTMAAFAMCDECRREYEDPLDRRFHAQPNACPACGPRVSLLDRRISAFASSTALRKRKTSRADAIATLAGLLADGAIAAVKGLGGYHLVCDATDERAVAALRARKHREDKPFALMVADAETACGLVALDDTALRLLRSPARPLVLAARADGAGRVAASVAPRAAELGVMLPYSPLHHLLLSDAAAHGLGPLVMTSGNVSDEPIAYRDDDALERLATIADVFLVHDREIETRTDDSVTRSVTLGARARPLMLRRSRGYVPEPLTLPLRARRPLLACGAEQKSTFCVARGDRAWVGHHIGDLEQLATLTAYREGIAHFERMFAVSPELVAYDLHPDYLSTQYALELEDVSPVGVQHHHAHLAACLAEHRLATPAVGAIFDGTGLGEDRTVWGGELLAGDLTGYERPGRLWRVRMPGGAAAVRQPWRMAAAWLAAAFGAPQPLPPSLAGRVEGARWRAVTSIARSEAVSPVTSSMGRLFDAVAVLCGMPVEVSYEGQAAVELEALAWTAGDTGGYELELVMDEGTLVLDPRAALRELCGDLGRGVGAATVASRWHAGVAVATVAAVEAIAAALGLDTAVLSGGVFQNRMLLAGAAAGLERAGLRVLVPERLPPNDGGISFGQAAVAAATDQCA
jgi:hydrogenase maturation protein HypF